MASVFTQVKGNLIGPSTLRDLSGDYRVGIGGLASLPEGCYVVNVHSKAGHQWTPRDFTTSSFNSETISRTRDSFSPSTIIRTRGSVPE